MQIVWKVQEASYIKSIAREIIVTLQEAWGVSNHLTHWGREKMAARQDF